MLGYLYWNPNPNMLDFSLPLIHRPILWYGFFFALGFFIGYFILRYLLATYLLSRPYFSKEDILIPSLLPQMIQQKKKAAFISLKEKVEGKRETKQLFWSEKLNKYLESSKTPQEDVFSLRCIRK